jgi:tRNA(Ile)-lysidine synthase
MGPATAVADVRRAVRLALTALGGADGNGSTGGSAGRAGTVLVACSGGADSLALAAATAFEAPKLGLAAGLITVDHGLQDGSAQQAARVGVLGYELGLHPVEVVVVEVGVGGGPEAAARVARYAALDRAAQALDAAVLLGHTLDDQAETVLLGLGRGSGARSIAGMRARSGCYLRPFLGLRRATTEAACAALGLEPWDDPHNADASFQRVRLRREALPLLEEVLQGGVVEALARTAELLRDDADALDALAAAALAAATHPHAGGTGAVGGPSALGLPSALGVPSAVGVPGALAADALAELPRAVRTRALRLWAAQLGADPLSAEHTASLEALIIDWHGQGAVQLPGGVSVSRSSGRLEGH